MSDFDSRELRDAFGSFMTGVTIVTAVSKSGEKVGFTANSFTSVSMDPPLLLVCPAKRLSSYDVFADCEHFTVSVLAEDQQHASNTFASSKGDRFSEVAWFEDQHGVPVIEGAVTYFSCASQQKIDAGDHLLLVGQVQDFKTTEKLGLGYAKGGYFSLGMERQAEAITHRHSTQVGGLVECNDQLLLKEEDGFFSLPQGNLIPESSSYQTLKVVLETLAVEAEIGQVFSVYEKRASGHFVAYYRAEATEEKAPAGYRYVNIGELTSLKFASDDVASMIARYAEEKRHGVFRLYVGNESEGDIR
ncbi:FMN reductase (NADH) NtaB [Vibrio aerogenes CECT 7868]|uniref:FMN reductase (NADH) NtaB n=1 Tax=Vibrio aerogenes CECT 7868 TaxID=1216006 RepID=A0A1M6BX53_9VIBR|nr:flavin reductase family protein [Vibrio aerogenes]SHI53098.1 FMN reductase (NADH) NtaB [Vibrio aerogenes CECT 7868]